MRFCVHKDSRARSETLVGSQHHKSLKGTQNRIESHVGFGHLHLHGRHEGRVDDGRGARPAARVHDALPLRRQPDELALVVVKARVHPVLEVGRLGDLGTPLLLHAAKHRAATAAATAVKARPHLQKLNNLHGEN